MAKFCQIWSHWTQEQVSAFSAPLLANVEQHRGRAQLDHHLPHADEHSRSFHGQRQQQQEEQAGAGSDGPGRRRHDGSGGNVTTSGQYLTNRGSI